MYRDSAATQKLLRDQERQHQQALRQQQQQQQQRQAGGASGSDRQQQKQKQQKQQQKQQQEMQLAGPQTRTEPIVEELHVLVNEWLARLQHVLVPERGSSRNSNKQQQQVHREHLLQETSPVFLALALVFCFPYYRAHDAA